LTDQDLKDIDVLAKPPTLNFGRYPGACWRHLRCDKDRPHRNPKIARLRQRDGKLGKTLVRSLSLFIPGLVSGLELADLKEAEALLAELAQ
jgi:hypothetical protein